VATFHLGDKHGKGYWKLNSSLLQNDTFKEEIVALITNIQEQYGNVLNCRNLWDYCKIKIKEHCIKFASTLHKNVNTTLNLESRLNDIDNILMTATDKALRERLCKEQESLKTRIEDIYSAKAKGCQIRSRARWVEEGEKNSKYFLGLEKKRQTNNFITTLKNKDGHNVYKKELIINETVNFYQNLYNPSEVPENDINDFLSEIDVRHILTDDESESCEGQITEDECTYVVEKMGVNKAPGLDGLTSEFYKCFWAYIKTMIINSFNEAYASGSLADTHKQSIITLIFKKGERDELKNYRPISLTNTDYKILAHVLANRLHNVIETIISPEQTSYIKGRYIGENVRLLMDIMEYVKSKNIPGVVLFLDFQKAFDSLNWNFIFKCLKKFGFKDEFCHWVKVIYSDAKAYVKVNGYLSKTIKLFKGIKQGCPLSALLFIICAEYLCLTINKSNAMSGILLNLSDQPCEIRCTQYADDTCIYLKDLDQVIPCLKVLESFSYVSGLRLNLKKTEGLCIGSICGYIPDETTIKWPTCPIRYLGIFIGNDEKLCYKHNWISKLEKLQKLLDSWRSRNLTLFGRVLIIKTFGIPQLLFSASLLHVPDGLIKKANKILYNFIWGARDKIKRRVVINAIEDGGLGMCDLETQFTALKGTWVKRILNNLNNIWAKLGVQNGKVENQTISRVAYIIYKTFMEEKNS
jgi:hypothetical protein